MSKERIATYHSKGNQPTRWLNRAESLITSADLLSKHTVLLDPNNSSDQAPDQNSVDVQVFPVVLMLRAMAMECFLKCLWLKAGNSLFVDGKYRNIPGVKPHDLLQLATAVGPPGGVTFSDAEKSILSRLTLFNARGRYPSQVNWQMNAPKSGPHGTIPPTHWFPYEDEDTYKALFAKVRGAAL